MRTKTLYRCDAQKIDISRFPNFHITGSITGMKKLYYGESDWRNLLSDTS